MVWVFPHRETRNVHAILVDTETPEYSSFNKTAQYPNALYRTMSGLMWVGESIVVTNDPDFPTNVMDAMIRRSQCLPAKPGGEQPFMLGSKSFRISLDYDDLPEMVYRYIKTNNEIMWNIFQGIE